MESLNISKSDRNEFLLDQLSHNQISQERLHVNDWPHEGRKVTCTKIIHKL